MLEGHEELAQTTRLIFTALTVIFAAILFAPLLFKRSLGRKSSLALNLAFLLFYSAGTMVLVNVAHQGGRLVHEFGVRAMVTSSSAPTSPGKTDGKAGSSEKKGDKDDE